jgi:hypothetical protein
VNAGFLWRKEDMNGIVNDGENRYREALIEEERRILEELDSKILAEKDPVMHSELRQRIEDVKGEYKEKRKNVKRNLF